MREIKCTLSAFGFRVLPAPAVQAYYYIPRIKHGEWVLFMIDTGASNTCLNGIYALSLQKYMRLNKSTPSFGIGGSSDYFNERSVIIFRDKSGQLFPKVIQINIQHIQRQHLQNPNSLYCPCLLGRDIINNGTLHYDPRNNDVTLVFP